MLSRLERGALKAEKTMTTKQLLHLAINWCRIDADAIIKPFASADFGLAHADQRHVHLVKKAWSVLRKSAKSELLRMWDGGVIADFCTEWRHNNATGAVGVNFRKRRLICYDRSKIQKMPDDVAVALITHEWAHDIWGDDEYETAGLNQEWHEDYRDRNGVKIACDDLVGEDLLNVWLATNPNTPEQVVEMLRVGLVEVDEECRDDPVARLYNSDIRRNCADLLHAYEEIVAKRSLAKLRD